MNFYEILEIDSRASKDDIERAYRKMARKVHPDLNAGDRGAAEARMKLLNEIRDLLTDPLLRAGYDERLRLEAASRGYEAPPPRSPSRARAAAASAPPTDEPRRRSFVPILLAFGGALTAGLLFVSLRARPTAPAPEVAAEPSAPTRPAAFTATAPGGWAGARPEALAPPLPASGLTVPVPRMRPGASPRGLGGAAMFGGPRGPFRGRGVVHIGSSADDVMRVLGPPDSVDTGRAAGDAVFHYGALRLEMKNGRVVSGDAAAR
ncbi:MAG TPA: DnaJ domain-containing protein [Polyangia bacterium]|jgi:hypothetical protein|nr:DnaJ domain-containing protein [Polyangia bacterium]